MKITSENQVDYGSIISIVHDSRIASFIIDYSEKHIEILFENYYEMMQCHFRFMGVVYNEIVALKPWGLGGDDIIDFAVESGGKCIEKIQSIISISNPLPVREMQVKSMANQLLLCDFLSASGDTIKIICESFDYDFVEIATNKTPKT